MEAALQILSSLEMTYHVLAEHLVELLTTERPLAGEFCVENGAPGLLVSVGRDLSSRETRVLLEIDHLPAGFGRY